MVLVLAIVKLPKMTKYEIRKLISEQIICRIAFKGEQYPYIAPFQYVFMNGVLYFHFANYGRKMKLLESNKEVCVEIEKYQPNLSEYRFVAIKGKLKVVENFKERADVIMRIAEEGKRKISENFLAVHGFRKEDGWTSLTPEKPLMIVKLDKIFEEIGLRSP
jgi:nitroimidazol reductase NimA-like FMN-containing flavoprotein (pyridoxamine 5'-phosphate oxidase superfamily)